MSDKEDRVALTASEEIPLPPQLESLSSLIAEKPETLATGGEDFRRTALEATKYIFDLALQTEERSRIIINDLLTSISPDQAPQTRSQKRKRGASPSPEPEEPVSLMRETPINQLFVEGMSDEQIWAQLELRAQNVCDVLDYALDGPTEGVESDDEDEARKLKRVRQALIDEGFDLEGMELDEDDEESSETDEDEEGEEEEGEDEDDGEDADLGEDVQELRDPSDEEDEPDEPEIGEPSFLNGGKRTIKLKPPRRGGHPELDDGFFDLAAFNAEIEAAESKSVSRGRLSKDDDEEEEEEEEEVDYFASVDEQAQTEEDLGNAGGELFYNDFFDPPNRAKVPQANKVDQSPSKSSPSKGKVRFHDEVRVKKIKAKGKNLPVSTVFYEEEEEEDLDDEEDLGEGDMDADEERFDDNEEMEDDQMLSRSSEDEDEGEQSGGDEYMDEERDEETAEYATIERLKDDLFADDEDQQHREGLSTYEKRMAALREEIAALEAENVGKKDWTLMGEATSRSRPQNSLLEEDLEFERVMKSVPVITEEVVHSLEERIKARILESQFDDVVRKRPVDDKPFLPSRFFELQDTKSKQSLAEIYEDEYTAAQTGGVAGDDRDGKLKKEHDEIEKLWENLCGKLDALCNAHFTPKAPKATITTVSNVAAATLESALPTTKATTTMLAPEEVYAPSSSDLRARNELTPAEKRALRNKQKKAKKKARDAIQRTAEKLGRPKGVGDVKRQKEAALKTLVKSGKGVTVVGKKSKEVEGRRGKNKS